MKVLTAYGSSYFPDLSFPSPCGVSGMKESVLTDAERIKFRVSVPLRGVWDERVNQEPQRSMLSDSVSVPLRGVWDERVL